MRSSSRQFRRRLRSPAHLIRHGSLFTDGSRLYFDSRGEPSEMPITGGPIVPMRILGPGIQIFDISTYGSKAVGSKPDVNDINGRGTLWTASMLGENATKTQQPSGARGTVVSGLPLYRIFGFSERSTRSTLMDRIKENMGWPCRT
jgi:hypothetical protein